MKYAQEMPDEKLLQFYLSNQPVELEILTVLYKDRIYHTIYSMVKDKYGAEEIFQNVFDSVINKLIAGQHTDDQIFLQWAISIAQKMCVNYNYKIINNINPLNRSNHCNKSEWQELLPQKNYYIIHSELQRMINMLPDIQRKVLSLNHYQAIGLREISIIMNCSVTAILDIIKSSLTNLAKLINEKESNY